MDKKRGHNKENSTTYKVKNHDQIITALCSRTWVIDKGKYTTKYNEL